MQCFIELVSFGDILTHQLKLWVERHMSDKTFHFSEDRLEEFIFAVNLLLIVQKLLHFFVFTLLIQDGKLL